MNVFVRAVVTGFGMSLGAAIFKRVQKQLGFKDETDNAEAVPEPVDEEDGGDEAESPA